MALTKSERWSEIQRLRGAAPRDRFLQIGVILFIGLCLSSWLFLDIQWTHPITGKSRLSVKPSFLNDAVPFDLRVKDVDTGETRMNWDSGRFFHWLGKTFDKAGWDSILDTLALSILAIVLAALMSLPLILPAAKNVALLTSLLPADRDVSNFERIFRRIGFGVTRGLLVVMRSIPEFIWAFIFLIALGPVAIAGVLALAIHNGGILGKLNSESVEDMDFRANRALSALGAPKSSVAAVGIAPQVLPQFLVYFFYRWETCVRETAILGLLAIHTIGFYIDHAFAAFHYDEALVFILMNSALVIAGDFIGTLVRRRLRSTTRVVA